jgi:hypothetical protein
MIPAYENVILPVNIAAPCGKVRKSRMHKLTASATAKALARARGRRDHEAAVKLQ